MLFNYAPEEGGEVRSRDFGDSKNEVGLTLSGRSTGGICIEVMEVARKKFRILSVVRTGKGTRGEIWVIDTTAGVFEARLVKGRSYPRQMWKIKVINPKGRTIYNEEIAFFGRKTYNRTVDLLKQIVKLRR